MKNDRETIEARRRRILNSLKEKGSIKAVDIAKNLHVSMMTVRRDLQLMEEQGLLYRTHGGAVTVDGYHEMMSREEKIAECRERISEYASRFLEDGDAVFINGSATALNILKYINDRRVTVYTNNCLAVNIKYGDNITVHLTGGELRNHVLTGENVMRDLLFAKADKTFLGCAAVYENGEFRYDIPTEIGINESMLTRTTGDMFILADHTKLQPKGAKENVYGSCIYDIPFTLITDDQANPLVVERLKSHNIKIEQVSTK